MKNKRFDLQTEISISTTLKGKRAEKDVTTKGCAVVRDFGSSGQESKRSFMTMLVLSINTKKKLLPLGAN